MRTRVELLRRLAHLLAERPSQDAMASRLCAAVVELVDARDGSLSVAVAPGDGTRRSLVWSTSARAQRFEESQDLVGEGPSLDVVRHGVRLSVEDLRADRSRWPHLADALALSDVTVSGLDVLPLRSNQLVVGALSLHRDAGSPLDVAADDLQFVADTLGVALIDDALDDGAGPPETWSERDVVAQATGMVMVQLAGSAGDAQAVLRARAFVESKTVSEISHLVVARRVHFRGLR